MEKHREGLALLSGLVLCLAAPAYSQRPGLDIIVRAGCPTLSITGQANRCYAIQYSTNLAGSSAWQLLTNLVLPANLYSLSDTTTAVVGQRFYRAVATDPLKVAIFSDPGNSTAANCVDATLDILRTNAGFNASTISARSIINGGLAGCDVVMFPGGSGGAQAAALQQAGCAKVEQFVAQGGGFVGTCAGAYLAALGYSAATTWLEIVDAHVIDVDHWNRGVGEAQIHIVNPSHPVLAGFPEYLSVHYVNGPLLGPGNSASLPDYEQGAVYLSDFHQNGAPEGKMPGTACFTTSSYKSGRCVLFSFHPELTSGLEQMDVRAIRWAARRM